VPDVFRGSFFIEVDRNALLAEMCELTQAANKHERPDPDLPPLRVEFGGILRSFLAISS
jgi:hypothetical protein